MEPSNNFDFIFTHQIVEKPTNYSDKSGSHLKLIKITEGTIELYKVDGLAIYAPNPEGCFELHEFYQRLSEKGEFGKLIYDKVTPLLKDNRFAFFGTPHAFVAEYSEFMGFFFSKKMTYYGIEADQGILLALERPHMLKRLAVNHEFIHFFFSESIPDSTADAFTSLSSKEAKKLKQVFNSEKARLAVNPHPVGSRQFNVHNYLYTSIFEQPIDSAYHASELLSELASYFLQFELTLGETVLKEFSPPLRNSLLEIAKKHSERPIDYNFGSTQEYPSQFKYMLPHPEDARVSRLKIKGAQQLEALKLTFEGMSENPAHFEAMKKAITVDYNETGLRGAPVFHGTHEEFVASILDGPQNIGSSHNLGGKGLYVAFGKERNLAVEHLFNKWGNNKTPGLVVIEGKLNPNKEFRVARIQLTRLGVENTGVGIFSGSWGRNDALQQYMLRNFDIIEVCGAADAGYAISSNRYLVVTERAGPDAIIWERGEVNPEMRPGEPLPANKVPPATKKPSLPSKPQALVPEVQDLRPMEQRLEKLQRELNGYKTNPPRLTITIPAVESATPFNTLLNSIGRAIGNSVKKGAIYTMRGLQVITHPAVLGPVSVVFAYEKDQEHAIHKALINGLAPLTLTYTAWEGLGFLIGGVPTVVVGLGVLAAELLPSLHDIEKKLPTQDQIESLRALHPELGTLMEGGSVQEWRAFLKVGGTIQNGLRNLGRLIPELYAQHIKPQVNQEIDEFFAKSDQDDPLAPYADILTMSFEEYLDKYHQQLDPRPFQPDFNTLKVLTRPSLLNLHRMDECDLNWVVTPEALQTTVVLSSKEVDAIPIVEPRHVLLTPIDQEPERKPTFVELAQVVDVKFEAVFIGERSRPGLVFTLKSGAKFSISSSGTDFVVNVSALLTKGFSTAIGTGIIYQIPIAAALLAINHFTTKAENKIVGRLKHDMKSTAKEKGRIENSLQNFEAFGEQFKAGKVDLVDLMQQANAQSKMLQKAADHMKKRGEYADKHNNVMHQYLQERTKLLQIDLDLKKLINAEITLAEVKKEFVPQIQQLPLCDLVNQLDVLSNKRVLSLRESFLQDALHREILLRAESEGLSSLEALKPLEERPMAVHIDAGAHVTPVTISRKHYGSVKHDGQYVKRQYNRVRNWSRHMNSLYAQFQTACTNGNSADIVRIGGLLKDQISRVEDKKNKDKVNLKKYEIYGTYDTAYDYYKDYIEKVKASVNSALGRVEAAQSGTISETNQAYFTADEVRAWKSQVAAQCLNKALDQLKKDNLNTEEKDEAFASLYQAAKVRKELGDDVTDFKEVLEIGDAFPSYSAYEAAHQNFLTIDGYVTQTLPGVATPLSKFAMVVLRDSYRYESPKRNFCVKAIVTANSFAPEVLPSIITYQMAKTFHANAEVTNALGQRIVGAAKNHIFETFLSEMEKDIEFEDRSFSKKTAAVKVTNAVLQLVSSVVPDEALQRLAFVAGHTFKGMDYANSAQKTLKYYKAGVFASKAHKVGDGLLSLSMAPFELHEFLATDPEEYNFGKDFFKILQKFLPSFHGNLPENPSYYAGKDVVYAAGSAMLALTKKPLLIGAAGLQAATMLWKTYQGTYTKEAIAAIMMNLRWFGKQEKTDEILCSMTTSYNNLSRLLGDLTIQPDDYEDNLLRLRAKVCVYDGTLTALEREEKWDQIILETKITQDGHTFVERNLDLYEGVSIVYKRFNALFRKMNDKSFVKENFVSLLEELERVVAYFKFHPNRDQANVVETLESFKDDLLTNFFIFYISGDLDVIPEYALARFDAVPVQSRKVIHWYTLGHLIGIMNLDLENIELNALRLFAFETIMASLDEKKKAGKQLSDFELSIEESSLRILKFLGGRVGGPRRCDVETKEFTPIIEMILANN